ncbi:LysM peptidoglycan-binding domain-containing protein [Yoonia vestfoldensis]|uniref:LysM peptidoglycan-binding domain-containing protein n=1 Tax=Yoonia vestfoldensis TaxID=245188 RepID=UPI00036DA526|nr:LysM peptidoglycan-binding domain-containing protein [Yoonia vestfoldensis]
MSKLAGRAHKAGMTRMKFTTTSAMASVLATSAGLLLGGSASVEAQELCTRYTVVRGDTLSQIASSAGVQGGFQVLFNANTNILRSPNLLEVGQVIAIPCADGSLPGATAVAAAAPAPAPAPVIEDPVEEAVAAPVEEVVEEEPVAVAEPEPTPETAPQTRTLRVVTAGDYAPFTDPDLPGGGLFTQLVLRAFELGNPDQEVNFFFVNDWNAQLDNLLPSGAVDMAFPWFRPDCDRVEILSPPNAYRCTAFNHSDPFYDALVGYYTLAGSPYERATAYTDLVGARLCRPDAWFTFDMEAEGLVEPAISLTQVGQLDCWRLLDAGEVDVVTYDALPAEDDARSLDMMDRVVSLDALTSTATLHVFVSKDNAEANAALPALNAGLEELRLTGEWFTIVREGIQATMEN